MATHLATKNLQAGYKDNSVLANLSIAIPPAELSIIIGPNACGKSTLLRSLSRLIKPIHGEVILDGNSIANTPTKELARKIGLLPQNSIAPDGISVVDLVSRGRNPHQGLFHRWSTADESAVKHALTATGTADLAHRVVDELSGGQRQRVWIAMALAQETPLLLLDEPTTFLDIAHQVEILNLCATLQAAGRTLVAVLHDLNQAIRYADNLIAMRDGKVIAVGPPDEIVNSKLIFEVFGVESRIITDPETGKPLVIPRAPEVTSGARTSINNQ